MQPDLCLQAGQHLRVTQLPPCFMSFRWSPLPVCEVWTGVRTNKIRAADHLWIHRSVLKWGKKKKTLCLSHVHRSFFSVRPSDKVTVDNGLVQMFADDACRVVYMLRISLGLLIFLMTRCRSQRVCWWQSPLFGQRGSLCLSLNALLFLSCPWMDKGLWKWRTDRSHTSTHLTLPTTRRPFV